MSIAGVGVVVLTYGTGGEHEPLIDALLADGVRPERILVVHNPATPDEPTPAPPAGVEVVRAERNLGYAGGMNLGIERKLAAGQDLIALLTHDARLRPGALAALVDAARRLPGYGVLAPALVLGGTDEPFSFGGISRPNGTVTHVRTRPETADGVFACDWVDGGTMVLRRELLELVGGFDERFWGYCEESELCLRARRAGSGVGVVLDAIAEQEPGGMKRPGAWSYLLARNGIEYARRAAGARGVLAALGQAARTVAVSAIRVALRSARLRPGSPVEPWQLLAGSSLGVLDFARRRWGPPPPTLPGLGDLSNA